MFCVHDYVEVQMRMTSSVVDNGVLDAELGHQGTRDFLR